MSNLLWSNMPNNTLLINCECHSECISISKFNDYDPIFDLGFYTLPGTYPMGWKQRLRYVWKILWEGFPYSDMVCLSDENAKKLADFIQSNITEDASEPQSN